MPVLRIDDSTFEREVLLSGKPVLVDFSQEFCAPCQAMAPELEKFAESHPDVKVCSVDADLSPRAAMACGVRIFPTLVVLMGDRRVGLSVGALEAERIAAFYRESVDRLDAPLK